MKVHQDGSIEALNEQGVILVETLNLDDEDCRRCRRLISEIIELSARHDSALLRSLLGYPEDLPDLSMLRPPSNTRPQGVTQSFFAKKMRGELPEVY